MTKNCVGSQNPFFCILIEEIINKMLESVKGNELFEELKIYYTYCLIGILCCLGCNILYMICNILSICLKQLNKWTSFIVISMIGGTFLYTILKIITSILFKV